MGKRYLKISCLILYIVAIALTSQVSFAAVKPMQLSDISVKGPWVDVRAYAGGLVEACADPHSAGKEIWVTEPITLTANFAPTRAIRMAGGSIDRGCLRP